MNTLDLRKYNFINNHKYIADSNKRAVQNGQTLRLAVYHHADMDTDEFVETYTGLKSKSDFDKFTSDPISYLKNELSTSLNE